MASREEITEYCNRLLQAKHFNDYCPNGLQVEGKKEVNRIVSGVSACLDLLQKAQQENADMILVHHGYFWKNDSKCITGYHKKRLQFLLKHDISLLAYHLPLDQHAEIGNNVMLAKIIEIDTTGRLPSTCGIELGNIGTLQRPVSAEYLKNELHKKLQQNPLMITNNPNKIIKTIAWCSGAAADDIQYAIENNVDAFITGEPAERIFHIAKETDITFYACGHHATERYGIQALGKKVANQFKIDHNFIDIPCPI
ncbi:MAG: Nif3-like dinuclear metal center hexameric protein [Pseudomonadota bacterium]|nr:Nif3-like dinuclear metal center hexameric protein [Pseudomonadota bacterium]